MVAITRAPAGDPADSADPADVPPTISYLNLHGQHLRCSVAGSGPPLLLLMGIGGNLDMWQPLRHQLSAFTTIAYDSPGTGGSPSSALPLPMPALAWLAASVLDALGYPSADVLGYSFGGLVAQQLALQHSRRVRRLILASTSAGTVCLPPTPRRVATMLTPARYYSTRNFLRVAPTLFGGRIATDPELLSEHAIQRTARPPTLWGYTSQLLATVGWSSAPFLGFIRQPTLVLVGDDDPLTRPANSRLLARRIPRAELAIVPGGGHLLLLDDAATVGPLITRFLTPGPA